MARKTSVLCFVLLAATACGQNDRQLSDAVDCTVADAYETKEVTSFIGSLSSWFIYADNTPGGVSSFTVPDVAPPGRCGDTAMFELQAHGYNFYGGGVGNWQLGELRADGTGYEGISFWARSPGNSDKAFMLYMDDNRTVVLADSVAAPGETDSRTRCRRPPAESLGRAACYYGGALPPSTPTRIPEADECGNRFHTTITTTDKWQMFLLPWDRLVQFPCPNRLEGGIDPANIASLEIKFVQGTVYDLWLDNFAFYRRRADAGN